MSSYIIEENEQLALIISQIDLIDMVAREINNQCVQIKERTDCGVDVAE